MEAVKVLAESKRINLDENDDVIALSDEEDESASESESEAESDDTSEENSQPLLAQSVFGGKCHAVKRQSITSNRSSMKLQLMQKAQASTTQRVAEKLGLTSADDLYAVLAGVELERHVFSMLFSLTFLQTSRCAPARRPRSVGTIKARERTAPARTEA